MIENKVVINMSPLLLELEEGPSFLEPNSSSSYSSSSWLPFAAVLILLYVNSDGFGFKFQDFMDKSEKYPDKKISDTLCSAPELEI
ncbi:hypothetical protein ACFX2F_026005 [Malus domestica]